MYYVIEQVMHYSCVLLRVLSIMPCAQYVMISIGNDLKLTSRTELEVLRASPSES